MSRLPVITEYMYTSRIADTCPTLVLLSSLKTITRFLKQRVEKKNCFKI